MSRRRVVFVTRRFWPLVGEAENALAELLVPLSNQGFRITVLTPRWRSDWPKSFLFDQIHVLRFAKPARSWWTRGGFARECAKWLEQTKDDVDLVVAAAGPEAEDMTAAGQRNQIPVVLLADTAEHPNILSTQRLIRSRPPVAAAVVVSHHGASDAWADAGYCPSSIRVIPPGVAISAALGNEELRPGARAAFARAIPGPQLGTQTPLAICFRTLDDTPELPSLLKVWRQVVNRLPNARLWVFGAGPHRGELSALVETLDLQQNVALPGVLECCDELLACADLYIALGGARGASHSLLQAMAAGLPVVAADTPEHRRYIRNNEHGVLLAEDDEPSWPAAMERILTQQNLADALGANARRRIEADFPLEQRVTRFASIFEELIADVHSP